MSKSNVLILLGLHIIFNLVIFFVILLDFCDTDITFDNLVTYCAALTKSVWKMLQYCLNIKYLVEILNTHYLGELNQFILKNTPYLK